MLRHLSKAQNRLTSSKRLALILTTLFIAFAMSFSFAQDQQPKGLPVEAMTVKQQSNYIKERIFTGYVEANRVSQAGFEIGGTLFNIDVDEGSEVKQGDTLATLDTSQLKAQQKETLAILEQARADFSLASSTFERIQSVFSTNGASRQQLDEARNNKAAAESAIKRAQATLERINVSIEKSTLHAPFDGVVIARLMDEGRVIIAGEPLINLQENIRPQARISLANGLADNFHTGEKSTLQFKNTPLNATVKAVLPRRNERMQTIDVVFALVENTDARPGDLVELRIAVPVEQQGFWVPISSLTETVRGLWSVYTISQDQRAQRKIVEILYQTNDEVFIRGSLNEGDLIVANGTHRIVPGQLLRVVQTKSSNNINTDTTNKPTSPKSIALGQ